jgi:peptidoglycan/LPS O-acetylase OafA/YrhL
MFPTRSYDGITRAWSLCTELSFYLLLPLYAAVVEFSPARRSGSFYAFGLL